jgi:cell division protein ZapA (FtsZ GTPase activity inhibitor)
MQGTGANGGRSTVIKILDREYRVRTDAEQEHLEAVAAYVDSVLREVRQTTPDTQDASVLAALNIASELLRRRDMVAVPRERVQALIELCDSAWGE